MRRLSRALLYLGTFGIVTALGRIHAQFIGHYLFHSVQRLPWNLTFAGILCLAAYGARSAHDLDRRRSTWAPAVTASVGGALTISLLQLAFGSLFLPRFVVLFAAILAVPWFVTCAAIADLGWSRDSDRDRIVVVAGPEEGGSLTSGDVLRARTAGRLGERPDA